MNSVATRRFWQLFRELPVEVQNLAVKSYRLWRRDPRHGSLRFRPLQGGKDRFTVRIGDHHRALGILRGQTLVWVWIGTHAEYDRLVERL